MKKIFILLLVIAGIYACSKDESGYLDVSADQATLSFEPVAGGAIMRFSLTDGRVYRVKAAYNDQYGNPVVKLASFATDSIFLSGFNAPQENVDVRVSFLDENENESKVFERSFSTLESAVYGFFDQAEVESYWDGFLVRYKAPALVSGFANVYFMGVNPLTQEADSILLETFPIKAGGETRFYSLDESQQSDYNTVVITTEDYKQEIAKTKTWTTVESYSRVELSNSNFNLIDPFGLSLEKESDDDPSQPERWGKQYLFDGDTKGSQRLKNFTMGWAPPQYTFIAGPRAMQNINGQQMYFVLDIKDANVVGEIRFYSLLDNGRMMKPAIYNYDYHTKSPCKMTIYGCNDYVESSDPSENTGSWVELGSFDDDPETDLADRWYIDQATGYTYDIQTMAELNAADPAYLSIPIEFDGNAYRYFKIEVEDTYENLVYPSFFNNNDGYVSFHEIEVYAKKN